jgi:hypothetical protein
MSRSLGALFGLAAVALATAGCGDAPEKRACMGGAAPSTLVSSAALFRLDVYAAGASCAGSTVAGGAGLPLVTHVYRRDEQIVLDVAAGVHAIVLTTFADGEGTSPLGQGCLVADLAAGSEICFDLTLDPYHAAPADLAVAGNDGGDIGVASDLSLGVSGDLSAPASADLSTPACTHVSADFAAAGSLPAPWRVTNSASFDRFGGNGVILNGAVNTMGGLYFPTAIDTTSFDATFTYRIAGPDGLALVLANAAAGFVLNTTSGPGGGLGYTGMSGYAFELDTWQNIGDPNNNHVGFTHAIDGSHIVTGTPSVGLDCGGCQRTAHVRLTPTHLKFEIDGVAAFDGDLAATGPNAFVAGSYLFGFTGSTGSVSGPPYFSHSISKVDITVGPAGACF